MGIVLASGSPRRLELLQMIGLDGFRVIPDNGREEISQGLTPDQTVCKIALQKAINVSRLCGDDDIIIAADTLVYLDGFPVAKPGNTGDAIAMLKALSGKKHTVFTGLVIIQGDRRAADYESTDVYFRELTESEISAYVDTGEPMDKAGAYAAQGRGALFIHRIEGDFFNVMGLPLCRLSIMLKDFGVIL